MPRPALAEARRREQLIDDALKRLRRFVGDEPLDGLGRRRQADHVEIRAADQRSLVGGVGRREALLFKPRENESVDVASRPGGILDRGHAGF